MAFTLLKDGEYGQRVALSDMVKIRCLDRDVLLLIGIFKDNVGKRDSMGEYYLLCVIKENARKTMSEAIAELLLLPEMYTGQERSTRKLLLEILGSIGGLQTVERIQDSIPLFEKIEYIECTDPGEFRTNSPKARRGCDMRDIESAIQRIRDRCGCA